ncbi:MAG: sulfur carrier protein ThiS adenylyltransferase ThiF [Acidaminobacteraceae bacterium]
MKVKLNGSFLASLDVDQICKLVNLTKYSKSKNLIYIQNGFVVKKEAVVKNDDEIYIIPKDMEIHEDDMQCFLSSRHSNFVIEKLKNARVAVMGLGGLGSNTAMNLARSGVGFIKLIDFDIVDPSNINRQNYFLDQIGMKKSDATLANLKRVNPYIKIESCNVYLDKSNYDEYLEDVDIIVEAFDNPLCKADITRHFIEHYKTRFNDKFLLTASGMAGFYKSNIIKTKRLKERLYICGDFKNSAREFEGLMAPRVNIVAGHQSNCVIRILMQNMEV